MKPKAPVETVPMVLGVLAAFGNAASLLHYSDYRLRFVFDADGDRFDSAASELLEGT
jgi:hypothetical protein